MEIQGNGRANELAKLLFGVQGTGRSEKAGHSPSASGSDSSHADSVTISNRGKAFHEEFQFIKMLSLEPEPAAVGKTERIREAIDSGTYQVSGHRVGDALIRSVLFDAVSS